MKMVVGRFYVEHVFFSCPKCSKFGFVKPRDLSIKTWNELNGRNIIVECSDCNEKYKINKN